MTLATEAWLWLAAAPVVLLTFAAIRCAARRTGRSWIADEPEPPRVKYLADFAPDDVDWSWPADGSVVPLGRKAEVIELRPADKGRAA